MTNDHARYCGIHTTGLCDCDYYEEPPFDDLPRPASKPNRAPKSRGETVIAFLCVYVLGAVSALIATALME